MDERFDLEPIEQIDESLGVVRELLRESVIEIREPILESIPEFDNEPKSARVLADYFGVTDRAIQNWYPIVRSAYCWLPETDLKIGTGKNTRYLPPVIKAMVELKAARVNGQTADEWVATVHRENKEAITNWKASQLPQQQPTLPAVKTSTLARFVEPDASPFSGLSIATKATDKREVLQAELVETEAEVDADFEAFMSLSTELVTQDEAADEADELEWKLLRKRNAAKWLKRKAILEADKQQILQGDIRPKQPGNSPAAVS
jgi:hypothetical protein